MKSYLAPSGTFSEKRVRSAAPLVSIEKTSFCHFNLDTARTESTRAFAFFIEQDIKEILLKNMAMGITGDMQLVGSHESALPPGTPVRLLPRGGEKMQGGRWDEFFFLVCNGSMAKMVVLKEADLAADLAKNGCPRGGPRGGRGFLKSTRGFGSSIVHQRIFSIRSLGDGYPTTRQDAQSGRPIAYSITPLKDHANQKAKKFQKYGNGIKMNQNFLAELVRRCGRRNSTTHAFYGAVREGPELRRRAIAAEGGGMKKSRRPPATASLHAPFTDIKQKIKTSENVVRRSLVVLPASYRGVRRKFKSDGMNLSFSCATGTWRKWLSFSLEDGGVYFVSAERTRPLAVPSPGGLDECLYREIFSERRREDLRRPRDSGSCSEHRTLVGKQGQYSGPPFFRT